MAPEETPWCNGKAGSECDNGLKRRIAHTSLRLSVTRGANTVQFENTFERNSLKVLAERTGLYEPYNWLIRKPFLEQFRTVPPRVPQKMGTQFGLDCRRRLSNLAVARLQRDCRSGILPCSNLSIRGDFMPLNIRSEETEELASALAKLTGETKTEAVTQALRERIQRVRRARAKRRLADELDEIALHCSTLPVLDRRGADEIMGYDENGLPR